MSSIESQASDNRAFRRRLKASLDDYKNPIDIPLWPLVYLATKLLRHDEALELIAERGFGAEAGIILRTMFEAAVNIMWIIKDDPLTKLKRYSDYQFYASHRFSDNIGQQELTKNVPETMKDEYNRYFDELNDKAKEVKEEYGFSFYKTWSGKTLKEMATEVGWSQRYATLYKYCSEFIHSGALAVQEYVTFEKDGKVTINRKMQNELCKACLYEGQVYLLAAFGFLNVFLDLKIDKFIEDGLNTKDHPHRRILP